MQRLFSLPVGSQSQAGELGQGFDAQYELHKQEVLAAVEARYAQFFEQEMEKLDNWADDKRKGLKVSLKELDDQLKELKKQIRQASSLPEKLSLQRQARKIETRRDEEWREYDRQARDIEDRKDGLLDSIEEKLHIEALDQELFTISWELT